VKLGGLLCTLFVGLVLSSSAAQAEWCQGVDGPYWCGDPSACQVVCSEPGSDCMTPCLRFGNTWGTCGGSEFDTDVDGDGIANDSDNCACDANSNQIDCDQDGAGDVCDAVDEKWVPVSSVTRCDWDMDWHFGYGEVELFGTQQYRELCTNSYCNESVKMDDKKCYGIFDAEDCCIENYGLAVCDIDNQCPAETCDL